MAHMATLSSKGQLVIPAELRKKYRLKGGAKIALEDLDGEIRLKLDPFKALLALRGKYAGLPLEETLAEARRLDEEKLESRG